MKKFFANIVVLLMVFFVGTATRIVYLILKWTERIKIANPENFPRLRSKMIIVSNHPDLLGCQYEIFLIPGIIVPQVFLHPLKFSPWFTLDKHNFTDKWYWAWLKPRAIAVQRGETNQGTGEARKILNVLNELNGVMIYFPEAGRTCTGKKFMFSKSGKKKIRILKNSVGSLILKTQASFVTMWLENGEVPLQPGKKLFSWPRFNGKPIVVRFGKFVELDEILKAKSAAELTDLIAESLLELADQE
jgi:1-acyl-sn-glycerol-3-phosphate acyltransferase